MCGRSGRSRWPRAWPRGETEREMRTWLEEARLAGVSMYSKQSGQWLEVCIVLGIGYPRSMIDQP